ncbi:MAG TPA: hypothetical protein DCP51_10115 [Clostridiales bacterium]|nr:MAG: hypothetical protein A2X49_08440 [Lentisphaerae bacterium GWF2_52_8]HAN22003.1 hypothetical protein [Clostridiales bacterium]
MYKKFVKRIFDMALTFCAMPFLLPLLALLALVVRLDSKGPVIFRQQRGGRGGTYFTMYKFRSMSVDLAAEGKGFEPGQGRRVTRVGRFLRKTKLDELPQLFNVLKGDMALVGPRPEVRPYIELYPERWAKVLSERPGLTDPASIQFRNEEEILAAASKPEDCYRNEILPMKLDLYENYVENISFAGDMNVLLRTVAAVLLH